MSDIGFSDEFDFEDAGFSDYDSASATNADNDDEAQLENLYFSAKSLRDDDASAAIAHFQKVVDICGSKNELEWRFKALKQLFKLSWRSQDSERAIDYFQQLLAIAQPPLSRNYVVKSFNNLLDLISSSQNDSDLEQIYKLTLKSLQEDKDERLCLKTSLRLCQLWLRRRDFDQFKRSIASIRDVLNISESKADQSRSSVQLEIIALEIQYYSLIKDMKKLRALYQQALSVKSAILHPRIMGIIRECGGKMFFVSEQWSNAQNEFLESFRNFDEAGSPERVRVLQYVVLANMLTKSEVDPFASPEISSFRTYPQIQTMESLVKAFHERDILKFAQVVRENSEDLGSDQFIFVHISKILVSLRTLFLQQQIKPYAALRLGFVAEQLQVTVDEIVSLLLPMILDKKIDAQIDEISQVLYCNKPCATDNEIECRKQWSEFFSNMASLNAIIQSS